MILTVATVVLVAVALAAVWFTAKAARALADIRSQVAQVAQDHRDLAAQSKGLLQQAERTEQTTVRVVDKFYRTSKEIEAMLAEPEVQRALRREGRQ